MCQRGYSVFLNLMPADDLSFNHELFSESRDLQNLVIIHEATIVVCILLSLSKKMDRLKQQLILKAGVICGFNARLQQMFSTNCCQGAGTWKFLTF
jgi:hypothetical protein